MTDEHHVHSLRDTLQRIVETCPDAETSELVSDLKNYIEYMRGAHTQLSDAYVQDKHNLELKIDALERHLKQRMDPTRAEGLTDAVRQDARTLVAVGSADYI